MDLEDAYYEAVKKSQEALKKDDYDLALKFLDEAEQLDNGSFDIADLYIERAHIYRLKKESDLELAALTKAIELRGFDWDYQKRAQCYEERGDYDNAIADYTKAIEKGGYQPESWQWRGEIFLKKNDYDSAIADFLMAIENCSRNPCKGCSEVKAAIISIYELGAPKFDVYRIEQRCFASFGEAYLWGPGQNIIGEKSKRQVYDEKNAKDWYYKPFNRLDCEEVFWDFDKSGKLQSRLYYYNDLGFEYMPSDTKADAGTHFKKGDFVKVCDTVFVISLVPGRKNDNRWENYYAAIKIVKKDDGRIFTSHEHFHESKLVKFTEPIDKSEPLWFLHQVFGGEIELTEEQGNVVDAEIKLVGGMWRGS